MTIHGYILRKPQVGQTDSPGNDIVIAAARLQSSVFLPVLCPLYLTVVLYEIYGILYADTLGLAQFLDVVGTYYLRPGRRVITVKFFTSSFTLAHWSCSGLGCFRDHAIYRGWNTPPLKHQNRCQ